MLSAVSTISNVQQALVVIALIAIITMVDSQFINVFYRTNLGTPNDFHTSLFVLFVTLALVINTILLNLIKRTDRQQKTIRHIPLNIAYIGTIAIQCAMFLVLFILIAEMLILNEYNKEFSLIIVYLSHIWSVVMLGFLFLRFIQWYRYVRSILHLAYGIIFVVVIFLILITIPLFTDQFRNQPSLIYPREYVTLVLGLLTPSPDIAVVYGIGLYVLPILIVSSWVLTVTLLKPYANRQEEVLARGLYSTGLSICHVCNKRCKSNIRSKFDSICSCAFIPVPFRN